MSITKQPQALQSLDLYSDLHTSNEKHNHGQGGDCEGCPSSRASHRNCRKSRLRRLLFPSMVALVVLGTVMLFSCLGGHDVIGWGAEDLVKRATGTTTGNGGTFTHNKLYLIVIFVGLLVVLVLGVMLSAWCCKGIVFLSPSELLSFLTVSFVRQDRLKTPCVALAICAPAAEAWLVLNVLVAVCAQKALNKYRPTWLESTRPCGSHAIASRVRFENGLI
ncbi:uncharacterized protein LACBIDRAFT_295216 [Laccaria bicolor S238N-H82]|uniref:Predicted protein n=1 Tax=Laccaria bicolor (strain S238N-H82 / ATCC MYA-4686) TaxID=486041 RepID=B0DPI1_LACBS|nr:uncharacterized protein LACBIDRAFT_295216 [Laccaria bicolor S238N-H82]EDR03380.1 predicted protein [Laccaria bicolor S238N-H82]|eukprot:XP_001885836.1 predicted protein [Laccaria bicolor S238N-H82]